MSEEPLATPYDAGRLGKGDVSEQALAAASARARLYTRQHISTAQNVIKARGPRIKLPARPVREVTSVTDAGGRPVAFELEPGGVLTVRSSGLVTIAYTSGWDPVPDTVMEIVCTIGSRLDSLAPGLVKGLQQENGGSAGGTFGWDSWQGVGGLVTSEKEALSRLYPRRTGLIVQRA